MSGNIHFTLQAHILQITVDRPDRRNALTHEMYDQLREGLEQASADAAIRCVLITGSETCFTAGNDLSDFAKGFACHFKETPVGRFLFTLVNFEKPLVAAVNGAAVGIGTTLLLHCEMVFAGDNARFQMPFVNLGLCPEGGSSLLLPQWLGRVRASELLMLGEGFDAQTALQLGLINRVCAPAETLAQARMAATKLAAQPAAAIRLTKALLKQNQQAVLEQTLLNEGAAFAGRLSSPEAREAFMAFSEKRPADFSAFD